MNCAPPLVLHVLHHLHIGGMENGLVNLVNHMPENRYRHAIACIEDYTDFSRRITRDVPLHALHRSRAGVWRLRWNLHRLCRQLRPALVHTRNQSGLDALLPARLAGIPCVHSEHGWDVDNLDGRRWKPLLLRRLHRPLVSHYITVSRHLQAFVVDTVGAPADAVTQIYNGVDTTRFAPDAEASRDFLPEDFRAPGRVLIGTVGRLQAVKDQATLLRAFAGMHPAAPEARLIVAGDGPLRGELAALAGELGIATSTAFLGATDRIPDMLRALDVFVLPSLNEGISNTILEAMASALPVLATAAGGNVELVTDGVNGHLFAPRDVTTLGALLTTYCTDPALRARHGAAARADALARFSLEAMVDGYAAVYDRVLSARRSP
ncbi:MAG: TIGR03088 family PEP-CTERM/XrtA system glycosyltransferase [Gammaproteobacteria bacterium]